MGTIKEILLGLGHHITNGHILMASLFLLYNIYSCDCASHKAMKAKTEFIQQCFGESPKNLQKIVNNPIEALWLIEKYGKDADCAITAAFVKELLEDNKKEYSPNILHIINKEFIGKYNIRSNYHMVCTFLDYEGKRGAIDTKLGYIKPQKTIEKLVEIIEKGYGVGKSEDFHYEAREEDIDKIFEQLNYKSERNQTEFEKGYL